MRLYISGPMTGIDDYNRPAFAREEMRLRDAGFDVFNPGSQPEGLTRAAYMRADIAGLLTCDGVATLPGWDRSMGAKVEVAVAWEIGIPVNAVQAWIVKAGILKRAALHAVVTDIDGDPVCSCGFDPACDPAFIGRRPATQWEAIKLINAHARESVKARRP